MKRIESAAESLLNVVLIAMIAVLVVLVVLTINGLAFGIWTAWVGQGAFGSAWSAVWSRPVQALAASAVVVLTKVGFGFLLRGMNLS